jgi:hypothetical protein
MLLSVAFLALVSLSAAVTDWKALDLTKPDLPESVNDAVKNGVTVQEKRVDVQVRGNGT